MKRATAFLLILALVLGISVAASASGTVVTAVVPELYSLTVARTDHIRIFYEGNRVDGGIMNMAFASQPRLLIRPDNGYSVSVVLLNGENVTQQLRGGYLTLPQVYENMTLSAASMANSGSGTGSYTLKGRVLREGKELSGVSVEISAHSVAARTNSKGEFTFRQIPRGSHSVTVLEGGRIIGYEIFEIKKGEKFTYQELADGSYVLSVPEDIATLKMDVTVEADGTLTLSRIRGETKPTYTWSDIPKTGDLIFGAVAVLILSGTALAALLIWYKRRNRKE